MPKKESTDFVLVLFATCAVVDRDEVFGDAGNDRLAGYAWIGK